MRHPVRNYPITQGWSKIFTRPARLAKSPCMVNGWVADRRSHLAGLVLLQLEFRVHHYRPFGPRVPVRCASSEFRLGAVCGGTRGSESAMVQMCGCR